MTVHLGKGYNFLKRVLWRKCAKKWLNVAILAQVESEETTLAFPRFWIVNFKLSYSYES